MEPARLRLMVIEHTCANKCMGRTAHHGGCCTLGERDWIIGPVRDLPALLERLSSAWGRPVARHEVVIDHEEGSQLFPERPTWQDPANFPALRIVAEEPRKPCTFYDLKTGQCTIHELRPEGCRDFECAWLKNALTMIFHLPEKGTRS